MENNEKSINAIAEAYGWLWHIVTSDTRIHAARILLRDKLSNDQRGAGIKQAKANGAYIRTQQMP